MIDVSQGEKNLSPIPKNVDWLKHNLENEEQVLEFLDDPNNQLEDQPTDVLIELAQKLKNRRQTHYEEMLRVQEEQDRQAAEAEETSKQMIEQKEIELKKDLDDATKAAEEVKTV